MEEQKEKDEIIENLKAEIEKLKSSQPLNYKNYKEWTGDEVYKFFVKLFDDVKGLEKYKEKIREGITDNEYEGKGLHGISELALKQDLGIKNAFIRQETYIQIEQLRAGKLVNNNNNSNVNEADPGQ